MVITSGCSPLLTCTATVPPQEKTTSSKCGERKICREVVVIFSKLLSCNALLLYQKLEFHCYNKENTCLSIHDRGNKKKDYGCPSCFCMGHYGRRGSLRVA